MANVHIYPSPFLNESRILKITQSLAKSSAFDRIMIVATLEEGLGEHAHLDKTREVLRVPRLLGGSRGGGVWRALRTLEWYWRVMWALRRVPISCVNCHSLPVLPLCVAVKLLKRAKLVYDTHELETETVGAKGWRKVPSKLAERTLIRFADEVCVVNRSIASWYEKAYGLSNVWVVRNAPADNSCHLVRSRMLGDELQIDANDLIFLYVGLIGPGRGIRHILEAFVRAPADRHVVFMGYGNMADLVREYARAYPNVHYREPVSPDQVVGYAAAADVGLSLIEDTCLSYRYCLPNKVLECVIAGVPVIVSDLPEMAQFVDVHRCGWKVPASSDGLFDLVSTLSRPQVRDMAAGCVTARDKIGWHKEEETLLAMYENLLGRSLASDLGRESPSSAMSV